MKLVVIGGGITGQLIQYAIPSARVMDWNTEPPRLTRQWGANYLWEPIDAIPCRSFEVITHIDGKPATGDSIFNYKTKIGKESEDTRNWPLQFKERMTGYEFETALRCTVEYGKRAVEIIPDMRRVVWSTGEISEYDKLVSTIPMYSLVSLIQNSHPMRGSITDLAGRFWRSQPIYVKVTPRPPDAVFPPETLYVNYLSDPKVPAYRYCDKNGERHWEGLTNMGTVPNKKLVPGKIQDLPPSVWSRVMEILNYWDIYCFGRYATWRSDELVHHTWKDIQRFKQEQVHV